MPEWLLVFLLTLAVIAGVLTAMAIGVMFKRPCLRGSCGGTAVQSPAGQSLSCAACPNRKRAAPGR